MIGVSILFGKVYVFWYDKIKKIKYIKTYMGDQKYGTILTMYGLQKLYREKR